MTKISQYTAMTTLASGDLLDISEDLGGSYGSRSITYANLLTNLNSGLAIPALGAADRVPYINAGATDFDYSADFTYDGTILTLESPLLVNDENELRLGSDNAYYNALKSPASMGSNLTYTMPGALPTSTGQVLAATTGGVMSWADNTEPVVKYVTDLAELTAALAAFNTASQGGIIKLGATITLAADLTIDFGVGIEIWGGGFGFNLTSAYKIIVNGTRGTFRNVAFTGGTQLNGTAVVNSQQCIEVDDAGFVVLKLIECSFSDIIGSTTGVSNTDVTSPFHIKNCANWTIFEFLFFGLGSATSSGSTKYQTPMSVFWTPAGKSGTRLVFKDFYNNSPEGSSQSTRFTRYRDSLKVGIYGSTSTSYQNQVVYDETLTIDSASTWPTVESGTTTSTTTDKLVESGQNFSGTVNIGDKVYNTTDSTTAIVTAVDSNIQLSLSADIMTSGENYTITSMDLYPNMYGPSTVITSNNPTAVATYGVPGDVVVSGSTIYMKHTGVGSDTNWKTI